MCLNGVFGTVCDDGWGITDGDVVCGLLFGREYLSKETYLRNNNYGIKLYSVLVY